MDSPGNYTIVTLQEDIPLSEADKTLVKQMIKRDKVLFWLLVLIVLLIVAFIFLLVDKPYEWSVFKLITVFFLFMRLLIGIGIAKYRKDIRKGKSILTGRLIMKYSTPKSGTYFIFAGPQKGTIKIRVSPTNYILYQEGAMLTVSFLPSNKVAINIAETVKA